MNIIELAKQVGFQTDKAGVWVDDGYIEDLLKQFADLVAAQEREECAKFIESSEEHRRDALWGYIGGTEGVELLDGLAAAIRARGTT